MPKLSNDTNFLLNTIKSTFEREFTYFCNSEAILF